MPNKSKSEIQTAFIRVAEQLDNKLEIAREQLSQAGIEIQDHSNRSGFDWAGPYFTWEFWFERREQAQNASEIISKRGIVSYLQPWGEEERKLVVEWAVEVFQIAQSSRFKKSKKEDLPLEVGLKQDMASLIFDLITKAENELPVTV